MSVYKYLPDAAAEVAGNQGWDTESVVLHLMGFIPEDQHEALGQYFAKVAAEEEQSYFDDMEQEGASVQANS